MMILKQELIGPDLSVKYRSKAPRDTGAVPGAKQTQEYAVLKNVLHLIYVEQQSPAVKWPGPSNHLIPFNLRHNLCDRPRC